MPAHRVVPIPAATVVVLREGPTGLEVLLTHRPATMTFAAGAAAQTTSGTISGRVLDVQGNALPGATAIAKSPNLQGTRETLTSEHGDYIFTGLPSGPYTITFSLAGFQEQSRTVILAPTQVLPLEVKLGPAQISEEVTVTGSADTLTKTAQIATNFSQDLIATLPTSRDLNSILLMAPGVHPTGPAGAFSGVTSIQRVNTVGGVAPTAACSDGLKGTTVRVPYTADYLFYTAR